jgi:hypothetical protein
MDKQKRKEERLEQLLRSGGGVELSGAFKRNIMDAVAKLPEPQFIAPPSAGRGWLDLLRLLTTGEKVIVGAVVVVLASLFIPGALDWIDSVGFSLSNAEVALSVGGTVLSASMLSIVAFGVCGALLAACGAYGARHRLIGA